MKTAKTRAMIAGVISSLGGFIAWVATVPPEQQSGILASIVDVMPLQWRPSLGLWMQSIAKIAALYAVYQAAHSGPKAPPTEPSI